MDGPHSLHFYWDWIIQVYLLYFLDVLPWIMLEKSSAMNGYAIDIMLVQLTGNLRVDYLEQSFYSGTKWSLNSGLMMAEQKFNSQKEEPKHILVI